MARTGIEPGISCMIFGYLFHCAFALIVFCGFVVLSLTPPPSVLFMVKLDK